MLIHTDSPPKRKYHSYHRLVCLPEKASRPPVSISIISIYAWIRRRDIYQDGRVSLDEFVASFQPLVPPDTPAWTLASARAGQLTAPKQHQLGEHHPEKSSTTRDGAAIAEAGGGPMLADGATDVAAAFGRIRLSASVPECRAAVEYALDYCRRVRDSPSAMLHWRIPLNSKRFTSALGRYGRRGRLGMTTAHPTHPPTHPLPFDMLGPSPLPLILSSRYIQRLFKYGIV